MNTHFKPEGVLQPPYMALHFTQKCFFWGVILGKDAIFMSRDFLWL